MKSENTQRSIFQLAAQSSERVQKFIDSIHNQSYVQSLSKGSIPLIHPDFHEFVDRSHDPHKPIYLTKYKPAKLRAQDSCDDYHANHLPAGPYQKLDMQRRTENLALEKHPLRYGVRTENERLLQSIQGNSIDHSMKDMSIYHFPDWKPTHHEKWTSQQTFLHQPKNFQNSSAWEKIPLRLAKDNNIYYDQEDDFKRTKNVQNKQTPFNPVIKKDPYPMYSQSIRTGKQDEAFGMEDKAVFSENNQLKQNYKNALIKTKSVDHIIPYNHSNNFQAIKNLFPNAGKQYLKSAEQMNQRIVVHKSFKVLEGLEEQEKSRLQQIEEDEQQQLQHQENYRKKPIKPFKSYNDQESQEIVDKYFHNSIK